MKKTDSDYPVQYITFGEIRKFLEDAPDLNKCHVIVVKNNSMEEILRRARKSRGYLRQREVLGEYVPCRVTPEEYEKLFGENYDEVPIAEFRMGNYMIAHRFLCEIRIATPEDFEHVDLQEICKKL